MRNQKLYESVGKYIDKRMRFIKNYLSLKKLRMQAHMHV